MVSSLVSWLIDLLYTLPAIIIALSFHEAAHAWVAVKCGDPTPKYMGRVTLDPMAHIDPYGLISLVLIRFGWGKPVVINPGNFDNQKKGNILVGLAGVTANFLLAVVFSFLLGVLYKLVPQFMFTTPGGIIQNILLEVVIINVSLMLFNLLPVPPLDGFNVFSEIFNLRGSKAYYFVYQNSMWILLAMIVLRIPSMLLSRPLSLIVNTLIRIFL